MKTIAHRGIAATAVAGLLALPVIALPAAAATGAADNGSAAAIVDNSDPGRLIATAAEAMLRDLDARRAEYRKEPAKVEQLVDRVLLPYFDTDYAARLVLGRHWAGASAEQRKRFVDGFYQSLLRSYGGALAEFTGDRLKVFPYKGEPAATTATVRTQVRKSDGTMVAVNYSLRRTSQGWKAWDVVIEGISYVKSFRDDFGAEVEQRGLDALIKRLESQPGSRKPQSPA